MQNILNELTECLKDDERLVIDGRLAKNKIVELALSLDESLIRLLLKNEAIKKHFFREVDGVLVFDKVDFQRFVSNKQFLPDSYTAFKNKIGLTANGEYLTESKEVVLAWPYKDCVLEGGQTKEDQKRKEIFWNETLAPDEIDRLLSPKVLTNFKKYDNDGEHPVERISPEDNLIIKGNNLLTLESLKNVYSGKVKLIYIDPPYNTGGDDFGYNDSFNHSSWLTFMKNRLEVTRDLLSIDGSIWINIDDHEYPHLKVLCDEIFYEENYLGTVIWQHSIQGKNDAKKFSVHHNYLLTYSKSSEFSIKQVERTAKHNINYKNPDNDPNGDWRSGDVRSPNLRENLKFDIITPKGKTISPPEKGWRWSKEVVQEKINTGEIIFSDDESRIIRKIYLKDQSGRVPESVWFGKEVGTTRDANNELKALFGKKLFSTPKPEKLIQRIVHLATDKDELVMDFFVGSGTTAAVCHKMQRQYLAIEQLDYTEPIPLSRIQKVIKGEQGGISKEVDWQGGGSFIYAELTKANAEFSDQIGAAKSTQELESIWNQMQKTGFISYRINPKTINENISEFEELSQDEQKRFLIELLDKNQLYVNYSEIDDTDFNVNDEDKKLNHQFYSLK